MSISRVSFKLTDALESAVSIVLPRADEKRQRVDMYIEENVPRGVISDQMRFKQVVMNLLSNAVKFMQEGGVITVRAKTLRTVGSISTVSFSVEDNGSGIAPELHKSIFEPFEQADTTFSRSHEGTGLGLPICKNIVEMMGGEISVESEPGKGSKFTFVLPLEAAPVQKTETGLAFNELKILVVDDEAETREYMRMLLKQYGVRAGFAASGDEALKRAKDAVQAGEPYNVMFVDMRMPGMNGIATAQEVKKACGEKVVVIMFSMYEWGDVEESAKAAGISLFLPKPIFPSKLLDVLYEITNGKGAAEPAAESCNASALRDKRILVVEDNLVNQMIIKEMLFKTGAHLTPVYDGFQAVQAFSAAQGAFDAILMDIQMPRMDGLEATRVIRASKMPAAQTVPIIAMTANVFREDVEKTMLAGMDAHVGKPIDPDDLLNKLCRAVDR